MGIVKYIGSQFAKPQGFGGRISTLFMNMLNKKQYSVVVKLMKELSPGSVLDIGFGNGFLLDKLSQNNNADFYGIEISEDMLHQASVKNKKCIDNGKMHLSIASVNDMDFQDETFDFVYTVNTVYFWNELEASYAEIHRVLKNDGVFANVFYSDKWLDTLRYTQYHFTKYSTDELINRVKEMNFSKVELKEIQKEKAYCLVVYK